MQPLGKTVWRFLKKLRTELPYDPAMVFIWRTWKYYLKRYMHPYVQYITIYSSQDTESPYVSNNGWMDKEDITHTCTHWITTQP